MRAACAKGRPAVLSSEALRRRRRRRRIRKRS
jgi:hypothetical protein